MRVGSNTGNQLWESVVDGYFARHKVKPGVTGWAQINGWRGEVDTPESCRRRVAHDLYYIENWSPLLDLRILMQDALRAAQHQERLLMSDARPRRRSRRDARLAALAGDAAPLCALGVMVFAGSVTMFEPGPYEFLGVAAILVWLFGGLKLRREMVPILLLVLALHDRRADHADPRPATGRTRVMWTLTGWYPRLHRAVLHDGAGGPYGGTAST